MALRLSKGTGFDAIIHRQQSLIENGHRRLFEQTLPIGQPDPVPRRQYRKKEPHCKVKARAMTDNELAAREQAVRERAETTNTSPYIYWTFDCTSSTISTNCITSTGLPSIPIARVSNNFQSALLKIRVPVLRRVVKPHQ